MFSPIMGRWAYILTCMFLLTVFLVAFGAFVARPITDIAVTWLDGHLGLYGSTGLVFGLAGLAGILAYRANSS